VFERRQRELTQQRREVEAQLETLQFRLESLNRELDIGAQGERLWQEQQSMDRRSVAAARQAGAGKGG